MAGDTYALTLLSGAKWLTDVAIVWLIGVGAYKLVAAVAPPTDVRTLDTRLARQAGLALSLLAVATAARLYAQTYSSFGLDEPVTGELIRLVAEQTRWGGRWQMQAAAVALAAPATALVAVKSGARWTWWVFGATILAIVGVAPTTSHAFAYDGGVVLPMALQIAHLSAAGVWLGTLLVLLSAGLSSGPSARGEDGTAVSRLVDRFSPVALTAATVLGGTGVLTAFLYVDEIPQLWQTSYGRVLLLKSGLFGLTAALGAYNWRRVRPAIAGPGGVTRLQRSGTAELLVAAVLLLVTAWLVHLPMPHE